MNYAERWVFTQMLSQKLSEKITFEKEKKSHNTKFKTKHKKEMNSFLSPRRFSDANVVKKKRNTFF